MSYTLIPVKAFPFTTCGMQAGCSLTRTLKSGMSSGWVSLAGPPLKRAGSTQPGPMRGLVLGSTTFDKQKEIKDVTLFSLVTFPLKIKISCSSQTDIFWNARIPYKYRFLTKGCKDRKNDMRLHTKTAPPTSTSPTLLEHAFKNLLRNLLTHAQISRLTLVQTVLPSPTSPQAKQALLRAWEQVCPLPPPLVANLRSQTRLPHSR